jgi:hypothetical protein
VQLHQDYPDRRSKRLARSIVCLALSAALTTTAIPQSAFADQEPGTIPEWLRPHALVRVTVTSPSEARQLVGEFQETRGDSIWIWWREARRTTGVPLSAISEFEVSRERTRRTWSGAGIGFLAGAVLGGVAGAKEGADMGDTGARVVLSGITVGCLGMIFGALIGHSSKSDHWTSVWNRKGEPR